MGMLHGDGAYGWCMGIVHRDGIEYGAGEGLVLWRVIRMAPKLGTGHWPNFYIKEVLIFLGIQSFSPQVTNPYDESS